MAGQIRVSPEQLRGRASEYTTEAGKLQEVISKMDKLLESLTGEWEGDASQAYAQRYGQLRPGFVAAKELIDEISKSLKATADIVERTDAEIGAQFRG